MNPGKIIVAVMMAALVYGTLLFCVLYCSGCKTAKTTTSVQQAATYTTTDSSITQIQIAQYAQDSTAYEKQTGDTVIGLPSTNVKLTIDNDRDTTARQGNITLRTYTDKHGKRHIDCTSDSLTLVIKNLVYERDFFRHSADVLLATNITTAHDEHSDSTKFQTTIVTAQKSLRQRIQSGVAMLGLCMAGMIAGYFIRMFQENRIRK